MTTSPTLTKNTSWLIAISIILVLGLLFVIRIPTIILYLLFLTISAIAIKFFKLPPAIGSVSWLVITLSMILVVYIIAAYYFRFVRDVSSDSSFYRAISTSPLYMGLILAPIIEELTFRRVFLSALLNVNVHWLLACSATAILFTVAHPINNWIYLALPAFFLSLIYKLSGSLSLVIVLHFLNNAIHYLDPSTFGATRVLCEPCLHF